jgi:fibronectin type III domain protein
VVFKLRTDLVLLVVALLAGAQQAKAGSIALSWDPTPNATGYHVYYGTQSGTYLPTFVTTSSTSATISGLQDCLTYYVAVKAVNASGESPTFSNELVGWSRPTITSATPSSAMQGDQIVMDVVGSNFQSGAVVDLGNPNVFLSSIQVVTCSHIQLLVTIEPTAKTIRPAQVGRLDVTVSNPDAVFGLKSQGFEVLINPARFDVNQSDATTKNRIDGKDTVYLSRQFGLNESDPNYDADDDFDGNGWVDGTDLAYIASNLGKCWSALNKAWSLTACPTSLQ